MAGMGVLRRQGQVTGVQAQPCHSVPLAYHFPSLDFSFPSCKEGSNTCPTSRALQVARALQTVTVL